MANVTESQIWCRKLTTLYLSHQRGTSRLGRCLCVQKYTLQKVICFAYVFLLGTTVNDITAAVVIQCPAFSFEFHLISVCL